MTHVDWQGKGGGWVWDVWDPTKPGCHPGWETILSWNCRKCRVAEIRPVDAKIAETPCLSLTDYKTDTFLHFRYQNREESLAHPILFVLSLPKQDCINCAILPSGMGARGEHGDVFLFSNIGALWFSEYLIKYSLHVCLREGKNNLFSFKHSYLWHFSRRFSKF